MVYLVDNLVQRYVLVMTLLEYQDRYNSGLYQTQGYYLYFSYQDALDQINNLRINRAIS